MKRSLTRFQFVALFWMGASLLSPRCSSAEAPETIRPFMIQVDESVLKDLRVRLDRTRWPDQIPGSAWEYGVDLAYMKQLIEYWRP